jgi:AcrR family transcriptional regulator
MNIAQRQPSAPAHAGVDPRLLDAGVRLFSRKGFDATGIRDIAREAGVSTSTLYHHIATKEELLIAIMEDALTVMEAVARHAIAAETGAVAQMSALVRAHVQYHIDRPEQMSIVDSELRFLSPSSRRHIMPLRDAYSHLWQAVVDAGLSEGVFAVSNPKVARLAVLEMCNSVVRWYSPDGPSTPEQVCDTFVALVLGALDTVTPAME